MKNINRDSVGTKLASILYIYKNKMQHFEIDAL
jgi:hypothetical protein